MIGRRPRVCQVLTDPGKLVLEGGPGVGSNPEDATVKSLLAACIMMPLLAPGVSAQGREPTRERSFEDLLAVAGLEHLGAEDKDKIEKLLLGLNRATTSESQEKAGAFDSVVGYLQEQGFAPELIMASMRDGQPILILGRILRAFTADLPDSLRSTAWKNGVYFVRWVDGGASEIIVDGKVHNFRQSLWNLF